MRRDIIATIRSGSYTHADVEDLVDLAERACLLAAAAWPAIEHICDEGEAIRDDLDAYDSPAAWDANRILEHAQRADRLYNANVYDEDVLAQGERASKYVDGNDQLAFKAIWKSEGE